MNETLIVPAMSLRKDKRLPSKQTPGAAAADLRAGHAATLLPGAIAVVGTGVAAAIPDGYVGLVCSRSGLALKKGIFVLNSPGVVDADFRGEIGVILCNAGEELQHIDIGDRIAQLMIQQVPAWEFAPVESLDPTERGANGFGSTGVA